MKSLQNLVLLPMLLIFIATSAQETEKKNFYMTKGKGFEFHFQDDEYLLYID